MNNTGKDILATIEAIAATPAKNEKKAMLKAAESPLFLKVLKYAYDPFVNYGISYVEPVTANTGIADLSAYGVFATLDQLSSRELSGSAADTAVRNVLRNLDAPGAEVFRRIINKDMRAGFSEGTINEVFKGTFAEFPYMRCTLPEKSHMAMWDWHDGIYSQLKADGSFANVNHDDSGHVWITTRQGTLYPDNVLGIEPDVRDYILRGTQTHGELTVLEGGVLMPREKGNGVLNSLAQGGTLDADQMVVFDAWDQIPLVAVVPKGAYNKAYHQRYRDLFEQVERASQITMVETRVVYSKAEAYGHYREKLAEGLEGTVCKHPSMGWKDTGSSGNKDQVKLKLQADFELRIKGFNPGKPGTKTEATFGSLICRSECGLLEVGVSGLKDDLRLAIHNNRDYWLDQIITARGNGIMAPAEGGLHSIFLPRFIEERKDKIAADTLEQIRDQFEAAMAA